MNKLDKFYKLKKYGFLCPDIQEYKGEEIQGTNLWTVRCLVHEEGEINSSSKVTGVFSDLATIKAREFQEKYGEHAVVFYYKYFIAEVSGTLLVQEDSSYAEITKGNLWNMKDGNNIDLIAICKNEKVSMLGNTNIITYNKILDLFSYNELAKSLITDKKVLLEWSLTNEGEILFYNFTDTDKTLKDII